MESLTEPPHFTEPSEDETHPLTQQAETSTKKRSSRACDHCRKTKSKCNVSNEGGPCKSCVTANIPCTFLGPTHKRGPPKGYIHALEQRWYQAESILGAILSSADPRAQGILSLLRQDDLASDVLNRVNAGPFGPVGRALVPPGATMEDLFYGGKDMPQPHGQARAQRQSRVSREIFSFIQDSSMTPTQVAEWRDRLTNLLLYQPSYSYGIEDVPSPPSADHGSFSSHSHSPSGEPLSQRRRLETPSLGPDYAHLHNEQSPSTGGSAEYSESDGDDEEGAEAFGQLSLDENKEVRYLGKASGLHLLGKSDRTDDRHENGVWRLPIAPIGSEANRPSSAPEDELEVRLPSIEVQDRLINLYFTYVHPAFPVIHKEQFLSRYNANRVSGCYTPNSSEKISKLLLLVLFSLAERVRLDETGVPPLGTISQAGWEYLNQALKLIGKVYQFSRPATCQALLLLGMRAFSIGSTEQAWIHIGMAVRMAEDLGLNRAADNWKYKGVDLFTSVERRIRKRIWWGCCVAEAHICAFTGRPTSISSSDFDTELPDINPEEDEDLWQPDVADPYRINCAPVPGCVSSYFRYTSSLSVIISNIIQQIYPVCPRPTSVRRSSLVDLENQLNRWHLNLPDYLRYGKHGAAVPHIITLNIMYWSAVLLLNRGFLPRRGPSGAPHAHSPVGEADLVPLKCFDVCQTAACHISTMIHDHHMKLGLRRASPMLIPYVQSAAIMHVVTLRLRPDNIRASIGWKQCLDALEEMKAVWVSAEHAWQLLHGVNVRSEIGAGPLLNAPNRRKRHAEDWFGGEDNEPGAGDERHVSYAGDIDDVSMRMMAEILGLDVPEVAPLGPYYPAYQIAPPNETTPWDPWIAAFQQEAAAMLPPEPTNHQQSGMNGASSSSQHGTTNNYPFGPRFSG